MMPIDSLLTKYMLKASATFVQSCHWPVNLPVVVILWDHSFERVKERSDIIKHGSDLSTQTWDYKQHYINTSLTYIVYKVH